MIYIEGWSILGYVGEIGYNCSSPSSTSVEDKGKRSGALNKWCLLAEANTNNSKREAEELILNLKSRAKL